MYLIFNNERQEYEIMDKDRARNLLASENYEIVHSDGESIYVNPTDDIFSNFLEKFKQVSDDYFYTQDCDPSLGFYAI